MFNILYNHLWDIQLLFVIYFYIYINFLLIFNIEENKIWFFITVNYL